MKKLMEKQYLLLMGVLFLIFILSFLFFNILVSISGGWTLSATMFFVIALIALLAIIINVIILLIKKK